MPCLPLPAPTGARAKKMAAGVRERQAGCPLNRGSPTEADSQGWGAPMACRALAEPPEVTEGKGSSTPHPWGLAHPREAEVFTLILWKKPQPRDRGACASVLARAPAWHPSSGR